MPDYTRIPGSFREEYELKLSSEHSNVDVERLSKDDPVIFSKYYLGKVVRLHQAFLMDRILFAWSGGKKRLAACLARQLGKSIGAACFLIWSVWFNKFPTSILRITSVYLVSRDDDASVELLDKMRGVLRDGDVHMSGFTGQPDFFSGSLKEPNNAHQITFLNNNFIKSIPPTGKILGKSASIVWIDEAHRLECENPDKWYNQFVVPTTAETGGMVILSSSPEGIVGFFYEAVDPEGKLGGDNPYVTIWFSHEVWDDDSEECERYQSFVQGEKARLSKVGRFKEWQQEYQALFTVTQTSFFENEDIDHNLNTLPEQYEWKKTKCSVGYDYGIKTTRTVITVRTVIEGNVIQLFQYRCNAGFDNNLLTDPSWEHSIQNLKKRYDLFMLVVDDSPPGDQTNRWFEEHGGVEVKKYNFRSDQMSKTDGINRNCLAYSYRAKLKEGVLKIPVWNKVQQFEMKTVQEVEQKVLISIKAPTGHLCDTFDSDMMACLPFVDMSLGGNFEAVELDYDKALKGKKVDAFTVARHDSEWERMVLAEGLEG